MRTVLLLGAGASAASRFHLPTMQTFFEDQVLSAYVELKTFLQWFYGASDESKWNLEEVMGHIDLQRTREANWVYDDAAQLSNTDRIYRQLLKYVAARLCIDSSSCPLHVNLFRRMHERDTIITLNYDLVADQALREIEPPEQNERFHQDSRLGKINGLLGRLDLWSEPPPSLMPRESSRGFYLKLHGSLDWLHCTTPNCYNNTNIFCKGTGILGEGQSEGRPCRYCGAALQTLIVPPVARKHIEDRGRLAFLWHLAWRELIEAERIIVAGLSLPSTDFELRWLLRYACQIRTSPITELVVINPNEAHWSTVQSAFSGTVTTNRHYLSIQAFLDGQSEH